MLKALKFVQRGVAKSDNIPHLTHFRIERGRVTGFNGTLAVSAPLGVSFDAAPLAVPFVKALDACEGVVTMVKEPNSITVRAGTFRASVPCVAASAVPTVAPEGDMLHANDIAAAFAMLRPFVCEDDQRRAVCGILLQGGSAYATNNVSIAEVWLNMPFASTANVPAEVVDAIVKIKEEPSAVQLSWSSITFHYADGRWVRSQLSTEAWPSVLQVLDWACENAKPTPISDELRAACEKIATFTGRERGRTVFTGAGVATLDGVATVAVPSPSAGCYDTRYLANALNAATHVDFGKFPTPVPFYGDRLRGALMGIRQ